MRRASRIVLATMVVVGSVAGLGLRPAAAQQEPSFYVVAVGDIACDPSPPGTPNAAAAYNNGAGTKDGCRHKAVGAAVIAAQPDQFWALGDNQYFDGTYAKYMASYDSAFGPLKGITRPVPGNHEWKDLSVPTKPGAGYFTYFGDAAHIESNGTYSFDVGNWHVLAINDNLCDGSHPCGPGSQLATWIANDMAANPKPCTVAMWHHPLWSLGESHKGGYGPMVPVWNQLYELGVDMVLTGHDHNYVRTNALGRASVDPADPTKVAPPTLDPKGMVEFVIGTGGVDTYAASEATAQALAPYLAAYQVGKPSPGLFGAGGFRLQADRYTFSYLPAANSAPFTDSGGRTCRRATDGNPQEIPGEKPTAVALAPQKVTWAPTNTTVKAASATGGTIIPSLKATTDGSGAISYAVTSAGTTGCSVNATTGAITYGDPGACAVTATAAATAKHQAASTTVSFTITTTAAPQKVTWAPSNTKVKAASATGGTITPSEKATTDGTGAITYDVTSAGTTGCSVNATSGVITYADDGTCEVTATAAATAEHVAASRAVSFTITPSGPQKKQAMTAVQPASGPRAGGNTIVLVGTGFSDASKVTIDGASATFEVVGDTRIKVVVPPGREDGPVDIRVTVGPPLGAIVAPGGYTYKANSEAVAAAAPATAPAETGVDESSLGNPPSGRALAAGLRLLSRADAERASVTALKRMPATSAGRAPVVRVKAGEPFALVVPGQAAGQVVSVQASVRGATVPVGAARVDATGALVVPALVMARPGVVTVSLVDSSTGKHGYVKVKVVK